MIWTLSRARGYAGFALLVAVACAVSWLTADIRADAPLADGPRVVRQYVVAFLPAVLAPVLVDRIPGFSASLIRTRALRLVEVAAFWAGLALVLAPSWIGLALQTAHFELLVTLVLGAIVVVVSDRWGVHGGLVGAVLGTIWVLAGDSIAVAVGFPGVAMDPWVPILAPAAYVPAETIAVVVVAVGASIASARVRPV